MKIDIVMPTWNQADCTIECLESIKEHTLIPYRLVWVDDGSRRPERDAVMNHIEKAGIECVMIFHEKNRGFTKSVNDGIRLCESDYLAVINNDIIVSSGWLGKLARFLDENSGIGMISALSSIGKRIDWRGVCSEKGPRLLPSGLENPTKEDRVKLQYDDSGPENFFSRQEPLYYGVAKNLPPICCLLRREMLDDIGLYDETMKVFGSDNDFSDRVRDSERWFKAVAVNCYVVHKRHVSTRHIEGGKAAQRQLDYVALYNARIKRKDKEEGNAVV